MLAHDEEFLRQDYAHRRLGFAIREVEAFLAEAGLSLRAEPPNSAPAPGEPGKLTVAIWLARDARLQTSDSPPEAPTRHTAEIA